MPKFHFTGTVFLWIYWPSFNGGGVDGDEQHRAFLNTYLSLAACTVVTFVVSAIVDGKGKFDMVCQNGRIIFSGVVSVKKIYPFLLTLG